MNTERIEHTDVTKSIIKSSTGWDELGGTDLQFYNAELAISVRGFNAGQIISCIAFFYSKSIIEFHDDEGNIIFIANIGLRLLD